jgi:thiol-disulfide isomerase/thioredoxin
LIAGGLLVAAVAGIGGLYGMRGQGRNGEVAAAGSLRRQKTSPSGSADRQRRGRGAQDQRHAEPASPISFFSHDGKPLKLSRFSRADVLLNLWATWCAPCRAEMPALDRLQQELGGPDFEVVAVNIDTQRLERPKAFLHRGRREEARLLFRPERGDLCRSEKGRQGVRHADNAADRQARLRAGQHGRPGGMVEPGCALSGLMHLSAAPASALTMQECSAKYNAAKAANSACRPVVERFPQEPVR